VTNNQQKFVPEKLSKHKKADQQPNAKKELLSWIFSLVIAVGLALLLRFFVFDLVIVEGSSMENTLFSGEIVFVEKISYHFNEPEPGEIIVCRYEGSRKNIVKRVIAMGGDEVFISGGSVYVNGELLEEPYIKEEMSPNVFIMEVAEDSVFVMGDNRNNSMDSRSGVVGAIPIDKIRGRAVWLCLPFSQFGAIETE